MVPADTDRTIKEEYNILLNELREYNPEMMAKPRLLAITKSDMLDDELEEEMKAELPEGVPYLFISSVSGKNILQLKDMLWRTINDKETDLKYNELRIKKFSVKDNKKCKIVCRTAQNTYLCITSNKEVDSKELKIP